MLSERKFNIQKFKMTEEMRTSILDVVRSVIEANIDDIESTQSKYKHIQLWKELLSRSMEGNGKSRLEKICRSTLTRLSSRITSSCRPRSKQWSSLEKKMLTNLPSPPAKRKYNPRESCKRKKIGLWILNDIYLVFIISSSCASTSSPLEAPCWEDSSEAAASWRDACGKSREAERAWWVAEVHKGSRSRAEVEEAQIKVVVVDNLGKGISSYHALTVFIWTPFHIWH